LRSLRMYRRHRHAGAQQRRYTDCVFQVGSPGGGEARRADPIPGTGAC